VITRLLCIAWLIAAGAPTALADEPPPLTPNPAPTSFGASPSESALPTVAPGDFAGLLRNCDVERSRAVAGQRLCEKDKTGIPFLTAAYLALWAILMVFFASVALRQKRMRAEMQALRERLARLGDDAR